MKSAYIYDAVRTPRGQAKASGGLHDLRPHDLLKTLYQALESRNALNTELVDEVILGCVTQHGEQAGNIAKTSTLYAGWPTSTGGITVNRFCSSGLDATVNAALKIATGQEQVAVAGGVEMMSRIPMMSDKAAAFLDPDMARACQMYMMGSGADLIASLNQVTREEADEVALQSQHRAATARRCGYFTSIIPVHNLIKDSVISADECIRENTNAGSLAALQPAFAELGASGIDAAQLAKYPGLSAIEHIHTAGNSPAMADAASLVLLADERLAAETGRDPRARVVGVANASDDPLQVLTGCIAATARLMEQQQIGVDDVDLFDIHEAFAATMVKCKGDLGIPDEKLNVNGGVIALGHPMGATGAIMLGTLLDELERRDLKRGIVATSGAAGAGCAVLIERC